MQRTKNIIDNYKSSWLKKFKTALSVMVLLSLPFTLNPLLNSFAQQQQNAGSLVNSICQLVQDNSLISGLVGLDQALNICNNLNSIGSKQALSQLCSTVDGINVINVDAFCNSQQTQGQTPPPNENNETPNSNDRTESNYQGNAENQASDSITGKILGPLFGFLNF